MLTQAERKLVEVELADVLAEQNDPRALISVIFGPGAKPLLRELPTSLNRADQYAEFTLDFCLRSRWKENPSMLELLLTRLVDFHGKGNLAQLRQRVRNRIDPNPDPFESTWVLADQPFFDRQKLRPYVKQLIERNDRPLLKVNGPPGSGRSYTRKFLEFIMSEFPDRVHVVPAEIAPDNGPSYEARELAESLTGPMGVVDDPPPPNVSSYPSALCRWILRNAMKQAGMWIFVLDGFGQNYVKPEVKELVQLLAKWISTGEYRKRLRLVLIDYIEPIPQPLPAEIMEEVTPLAESLGTQDLVQCLVAHNARMRALRRVEIEEAGLPRIADDILRRAPASGKARLQFVYDELVALASMPS